MPVVTSVVITSVPTNKTLNRLIVIAAHVYSSKRHSHVYPTLRETDDSIAIPTDRSTSEIFKGIKMLLSIISPLK